MVRQSHKILLQLRLGERTALTFHWQTMRVTKARKVIPRSHEKLGPPVLAMVIFINGFGRWTWNVNQTPSLEVCLQPTTDLLNVDYLADASMHAGAEWLVFSADVSGIAPRVFRYLRTRI